MTNFFRAKRPDQDMEPQKNFTRFKKWHTRERPAAAADGGIDPHDNLTRMAATHVRPAVAPRTRPAPVTRPQRRDVSGDLHATDPISIDVLRKALPMRSAMILG